MGVRAATITALTQATGPRSSPGSRPNEVDLLLESPERLANADFWKHVLLHLGASAGLRLVDGGALHQRLGPRPPG